MRRKKRPSKDEQIMTLKEKQRLARDAMAKIIREYLDG